MKYILVFGTCKNGKILSCTQVKVKRKQGLFLARGIIRCFGEDTSEEPEFDLAGWNNEQAFVHLHSLKTPEEEK